MLGDERLEEIRFIGEDLNAYLNHERLYKIIHRGALYLGLDT
jgi:hypothetical protein